MPLVRAFAALAAALVLVLAGGLVPASRAMACTCAGAPDDQLLAAAPVVFVGVVTAEPFEVAHWFASGGDDVRYTFAVEEVTKGGPLHDRVEVATALDGAACGAGFALGQRWRVLARPSGDHLESGLCSGNRLLARSTQAASESVPVGVLLIVVVVGATALALLGLRRLFAR